jgi:CelD/BcsL family acetyltransferase involved in cellulose biosynthesis
MEQSILNAYARSGSLVDRNASGSWQLIRDRDGFAQLEDRWRLMETQWEGGTPFQSFAWCNQWLKYRGKGYTPFILVHTDRGLIAPFAMTIVGRSRVLRLIGTGDSDYLGLVTSMSPGEAWRSVIAELHERKGEWHLLHLHSIKEKDDILSALRQCQGISVIERDYEKCPRLSISGTWEAYLGRRKKVKYESRRWAKRVHEYGAVTVDSVALPLSSKLVREMVDVERESWKWELGTAALKPGEQADFVCAILQDPQMPARVWCLRTDAQLVAFAVMFEDKDTWYYYLPSFRSSYHNAGAYLLSCIMEEAFRLGCRSVDLLQGDHGYKSLWTDQTVGVAEILAGNSLWGRLLLLGYIARWRASHSVLIRRIRDTYAIVGDRRPVSHLENMVISSLLAELVSLLS